MSENISDTAAAILIGTCIYFFDIVYFRFRDVVLAVPEKSVIFVGIEKNETENER